MICKKNLKVNNVFEWVNIKSIINKLIFNNYFDCYSYSDKYDYGDKSGNGNFKLEMKIYNYIYNWYWVERYMYFL